MRESRPPLPRRSMDGRDLRAHWSLVNDTRAGSTSQKAKIHPRPTGSLLTPFPFFDPLGSTG